MLRPVSIAADMPRTTQVLLEKGEYTTQHSHNDEDLRGNLCTEVNLRTKSHRPHAGVRFGEVLEADVPLIACALVLIEKDAH